MQRYSIPNMTCGRCANVIARAVMNLDPRAEMTVDLAAKEIAVRAEAVGTRVTEAIRSAGYENQPIAA